MQWLGRRGASLREGAVTERRYARERWGTGGVVKIGKGDTSRPTYSRVDIREIFVRSCGSGLTGERENRRDVVLVERATG